MEKIEKLSQYFRNQVAEMEADFIQDAPPDEKEEAAAWAASTITSYLLDALEAFSPRPATAFETLFSQRLSQTRNFFESQFDEHYTRQLLDRIPQMVARTFKLSPMFPNRLPSAATNLYLKEATRGYIFGFWQGSVALSRAAVEQGLRETVSEKAVLRRAKFCDFIAAAIRLKQLDDEHSRLATYVEMAGNEVLHGKPSNERESFKTLMAARNVLLYLYGSGE